MPLLQIAYASRPFGYDGTLLTSILLDARRCNMRDDVSGALICRDDIYLQLLEGPAAAVDATFARIQTDDRHLEVRSLLRREILPDQRMFRFWAMKNDPAASVIWSRDEVAAGVPERASEAEVLAVFARLAA